MPYQDKFAGLLAGGVLLGALVSTGHVHAADAADANRATMKNPAAHFDVKHIVIDGDMAAVHFRGSLGAGMGAAVLELFRLNDGKIVEHWDAFQVIDPKASARNPHPYF